MGQLLVESVVLALFGGLLALAFAYVLLTLVRQAEGVSLPRLQDVSIDGWVLCFTALASVVTGMLFGGLPALRLSRASPAQVLRGEGGEPPAGRGARAWTSLVTAEVALAFVLISGSLLLVRSARALLAAERGFVSEGVTTADLDLDPAAYPEPRVKSSSTRPFWAISWPTPTSTPWVSALQSPFPGSFPTVPWSWMATSRSRPRPPTRW